MCICVRSSPYVVLSHTSYYKRAKYRIGGANSRCQPVNFICKSAFMSNILISVRLERRASVHDRSIVSLDPMCKNTAWELKF